MIARDIERLPDTKARWAADGAIAERTDPAERPPALMRCFWDERSRAHAPQAEFFNGALHPAADVVERVDLVLAAIGPTEAPPPRSEAELLAAAGQGAFEPTISISSASLGTNGRRRGGAATSCLMPFRSTASRATCTGSTRGSAHMPMTPARRSWAGTWGALLAGTGTLLAALDAALAGDHAFALTRPPGHHAGPDYMGGYSYLNWAAIAALAARQAHRDPRPRLSSRQRHAGYRRGRRRHPLRLAPRRSRAPIIPISGAAPRRAAATSSTCPCRAAPPSTPMTRRSPAPATGWRKISPNCWW